MQLGLEVELLCSWDWRWSCYAAGIGGGAVMQLGLEVELLCNWDWRWSCYATGIGGGAIAYYRRKSLAIAYMLQMAYGV
jgi:hypothetical protein